MSENSNEAQQRQTRRWFTATALAAAALLTSARTRAGETPRFDEAGFAAAQEAGRPILVHVGAPWCPICKAQKPILARLGKSARYSNLAIFEVDFDSRKDLLRRFDARSQGTLILFKGKAELDRSVGETQPEWIEDFLEKAL